MTTTTNELLQNAIAKGMEYEAYVSLSQELFAQQRTSPADGDVAKADMLEYTKLNLHRMERLDRTLELDSELVEVIQQLQKDVYLVVIAEAWCGDAAQNVPIFAKMAAANPAKLHIRLMHRDTNLELIDAYLTNGGRAIPKVVLTNAAGDELAVWGARPAAATAMVKEWKAQGMEHSELAKNVQLWYAKDKGISTQTEFKELFKQLIANGF